MTDLVRAVRESAAALATVPPLPALAVPQPPEVEVGLAVGAVAESGARQVSSTCQKHTNSYQWELWVGQAKLDVGPAYCDTRVTLL